MPRRRRKSRSSLPAALFWLAALSLCAYLTYQFFAPHTAAPAAAAPIAAPPIPTPSPMASDPNDTDTPQRIYVDDPLNADAPAETVNRPAPRSHTPEVLLAQAAADFDQNRIVAARDSLNATLAELDATDPRATTIRRQLTALNAPVFLAADVLPDDPYAPLSSIAPADTIQKIARRCQIPSALLIRINPTAVERRLRTAGSLKLIYGPFHARICKAAGTLDLYCRDLFIRSYPIALADGDVVPNGIYTVTSARAFSSAAPARYDASTPVGTAALISLRRMTRTDAATICLYAGATPASPGIRLDPAAAHDLPDVLLAGASLVKIER